MHPSRSDLMGPATEVVEDIVRGRRVLTRDAAGRIVGAVKPDGLCLRTEYDENGRTRLIDAGDVRVEHELKSGPTSHDLIVRDQGGTTEIRMDHDGWSLARRGWRDDDREFVLAAESSRDGRVRQMRIPGSPDPLEFDYHRSGCIIRSGSTVLVRLVERADHRRWRIANGTLEERREGTRWRLLASTGREQRASITVVTDFAGRTIQRTRSDGYREEFWRDADGQLTGHRWQPNETSPWTTRSCDYRDGELIRISVGTRTTTRKTDGAGRVTALVPDDGVPTCYEYDARGRRIARTAGSERTTYSYDGLDRLVRIGSAGGVHLTAEFDGLGRRVAVTTREGRLLEHRDAEGRLWSVTDCRGVPVASYVWFEGRILLRVDGPLNGPLRTAYLTDPLGTPLVALSSSGGWRFLDAAPYGSIDDPLRPTIYGHFGNPVSGLIHCGARELDPETGTFLTPEPWHGGADDERRWAEPAHVRTDRVVEGGVGRRHDYALCRFDPVGRADYDGHVSGGAIAAGIFRGLGNIILGPTWGWPLTAISLFFFLPFNLYAEVVAGIVAIFIQRHPWKNHTIFGLRGLFGSLRQGQISFALNGFLPRVISGGGIHGDRAVTIGNVIWINRHELHSLDRPLVVEVDDIAAVGGAGRVAFNTNSNVASVVALEIADSDGRQRVHVTYWSRGYGNAIKTVAVPGGSTALAFEDREVGGRRTGTLLLAQPVPLGWDPPDATDDKEKLVVREFVRQATDPEADVVLVDDVWFALKLEQNKSEKLKAGDAVEIEADPARHLDAAHSLVGRVQNLEDYSLVFLLGDLPSRFQTANIEKDMVVHRITDDASVQATTDWQDTTRSVLEASAPGAPAPGGGAARAWPPNHAKGDLVKVKAATAGPAVPTLGMTAPPAIDTVHARLTALTATLEVTEALPAGFGASVPVRAMADRGKVQTAKLADPAKNTAIEFTADPDGLSKNDYMSVVPSGLPRAFAKIDAIDGRKVTLAYLSAVPAYTGAVDLQIRKLVDRDGDDDPKGTAANPAGTSFAMDVPRFKPFVAGTVLHLKDGPTEAIRSLKQLAGAKLTLSDEVVGVKPFTVSGAKRDSSLCRIKDVARASMPRFLKHTGGAAPATFGTYPSELIEVDGWSDKRMVRFFLRQPPGMHESYSLTWSPVGFGADNYFVLDEDLPLLKHNSDAGKFVWAFDPDEHYPDTNRYIPIGARPAGGWTFKVRSFKPSNAVRGQGTTATAHSAEVIVPADPQFRYSWGDALQEHEIHHTLQGNYYGPLLGAFPLQAAIMSIADLAELDSDNTTPEWFRDIPSDFFGGSLGLGVWQTFSVGGIMYLAWKFLFLPPAYFSEDAQKTILHANFATMNRVFNPFWGNLIAKFPVLDPNLSQRDSDPGVVITRLLARAMDLRSWTPFLGFVPTWLPDGPQNFIEQGASRMSGDLYSTILSTDDGFNAKLSFRIADWLVRDDHGADVEKPLGSVFRLMMFPGDRWERITPFDHADRPVDTESPILYNVEDHLEPIVRLTAPADTLFHPDLYVLRNAAPATVAIEGPLSNPGVVNFVRFPAGGGAHAPYMEPTLRSLVPLPPRVSRTAGTYFVPAQPAIYQGEAHDSEAGTAKDARTQNVTLTVSGKVLLGSDEVAWQVPVAHPAVPAGPSFNRFVTESIELTMKSAGNDLVPTDGFEARVDAVNGTTAPQASIARGKKQWTITAGDAAATLRVRVYRLFRKNDFADDRNNEHAFDLKYAVPSLEHVRSYLDKDIWVPVRDFLINVTALPAMTCAPFEFDRSAEVTLPLEVTKGAIAITPPAGAPGMPTPDRRSERVWRFGPLETPVEETTIYKVEVTFGKGAITAKSTFDITVNPVMTLKSAGTFEAAKGSPLELTIEGGTASFSAEAEHAPNGTTVAVAGRKVTVTVAETPASATKVVIVVTDDQGRKGRRTITVR